MEWTPGDVFLLVSLVANAAQAMWTQYLKARYDLVEETKDRVRHETSQVAEDLAEEPPSAPR